MSELPKGWVETTLGSLVNNKTLYKPLDGNHGDIHPKSDDFVSEGIPFVMASDLKDGKVDLLNCSFITKNQADLLRKGFAINDDVLLSHKATIGRTALLKTSQDYVMLTPQVTYYRIEDKSKLSNIFLKYYFDSSFFQRTMLSYAGGGSTRLYIGITRQLDLPITMPPLPEQKAIAKLLSSFDEKIELLRAQNETLETLAQTIFKEWFCEFNYPNATDERVNSDLGEVPKGWQVTKISDLFDVRDGTHDSPKQKEKGYYLITSKHLSNHQLDFDSAYFISEKDYVNINKRSAIHTNDILFSMIGTLGSTYLEQSSIINYAIKNVGLFKTSQNEDWIYYTYLWLTGLQGKNYIFSNKSGSTQEYMSLTSLRNILFCEPTEEILGAFNTVIEVFFKKIKNNTSQIKNLVKTRDTLLPKLISGEIRIKGFGE